MTDLKLYNLDEVSEILQIGRQTLYAHIKDGSLKAFKIGRYWRVAEEDLKDFISKGSSVKAD